MRDQVSNRKKNLIPIFIIFGVVATVFLCTFVKEQFFLLSFKRIPFESENYGEIEAIEIVNNGAGMILLQDHELWRSDIIYVPDISDFSQNQIITTDVIDWSRICVFNNQFLSFVGGKVTVINLQTGENEVLPTEISDTIGGIDCVVSDLGYLVIASTQNIVLFDGSNWDIMDINLDRGGVSISETPNGQIMLATTAGDIYTLDEAKHFELVTHLPIPQNSIIFEIKSTINGDLLIRTNKGIFLWQFEEDTLEIDLVFEAPNHLDIAYDFGNRFFISDKNSLWMVENGQSNQLIKWKPEYKRIISSFNFDPWNEILYVAITEKGLYYLNVSE